VIVGPTLGGLLARPAVQYPGSFAADGLFGWRPYLLPALAVAANAALALCLSQLVLRETVSSPLGLRCGPCAAVAGGAKVGGSGGAPPATAFSTARAGGAAPGLRAEGRARQCARFCGDRKAGLAMLFYTLLITAEFADEVCFGFGRIVVSEIKVPNMLGYTVS
jgi:hypothetical protein